MTSTPQSTALALLAFLGCALAASPAVADEGGGAPAFEHESEYDKPIYGPDDTDCDIYGHWELYGTDAEHYGWTFEVANTHVVTESGDRLSRLSGLKRKHFEDWPEGKIGFYGEPEQCRDDCTFVYVVHVEPHITMRCLLRTEGFRGTREGYVDQDRYRGSVTYQPPLPP